MSSFLMFNGSHIFIDILVTVDNKYKSVNMLARGIYAGESFSG